MFELVDEVIRSNRRTIELRVKSDGKVQLRIPNYADKKKVSDFIRRKKDWIIKHKSKRAHLKFERKYADGEKIYYLGEEHTIVHRDQEEALVLEDDKFFLHPEYSRFGKEIFKQFFKVNAKAMLIPIAWDHANYLKIKINNVKVSSAEKRWGSCSSKGNINLSYMLMMLKPSVINYVIVHELAHIYELSHNKRFWGIVAKIMPDYKKEINWIDKHSHLLKL